MASRDCLDHRRCTPALSATARRIARPEGTDAMMRRHQLVWTSPSVPRPVSLSWWHGALEILHANCSTAPHWAVGSALGSAEHCEQWLASCRHLAPPLPLAERRALRARYRCQGRKPHSYIYITHSTPLPSPPHSAQHSQHHTSRGRRQTLGVFLVTGFPPSGAAGVHIHLTLSHTSYHLLNCPIDHRRSWTRAAHRHGRKRRCWSPHDGPYPLRPRQHSHAAGTDPMPRWASGRECPLSVAGGEDYRAPQPPSHPHPSSSTRPNPITVTQ
jgi:hypothetical protein